MTTVQTTKIEDIDSISIGRAAVKEPQGKIDESKVRTFADMAINSGVYTFTFKEGVTVQARFTFVYRWNGQRWMIVEHHSSAMPE